MMSKAFIHGRYFNSERIFFFTLTILTYAWLFIIMFFKLLFKFEIMF